MQIVRKLKVVPAPAVGSVIHAPPVHEIGASAVHYTCGHCNTVLLRADEGQPHKLILFCTQCGTHNSTER